MAVQRSVPLSGVQEKLGVMNKGTVYALWDYEAQSPDELSFRDGEALTVLKRRDESETEWWWARLKDREGYVPRNLLGVSLKTPPESKLFVENLTETDRQRPTSQPRPLH